MRKSNRSHRRSGIQWVTAVVATATTIGALAGCSSTSPGTSSPAGPSTAPGNATSGTITWWASPLSLAGTDPRTVLIADFEKAYPNIKVKLISAPNNTDTDRATLTTQISGGGGPDVYMGDVIWPAQFAAHQLAMPISQYLPKSYFDTFASGLVAGATYKNQVYGAPFFADSGLLYYRKDLLTQNNMSVPTTWEEMVKDAKAIQAKGQAKYGYVFQGASYEGATCNFAEVLADAGGSIVNPSGTKATLDSPAAIKALTFMRSLVTDGVSPKAVSTYQETQSMSAFASGKAVFMRNWPYAYGASQAAGSAVIGKVGVAPLPNFAGTSGPGYSNVGGWNLYVNPHSKNVAADLTFIKWMTGKAAQSTLATRFAMIPTNQSVRASSAVVNGSPVMAVLAKTRLVARPSQTPEYPAVSKAIYTNVSAALSGTSSPTSAIQAASKSVQTAITGGGL